MRADHREQPVLHLVGLGEHARDEVLEPAQAVGAHLHAHVLRDAAITLEAAFSIEHRLAAEAHVAHALVGTLETMDDVAERPSRVEVGPVPIPATAVGGRAVAELPARLADDLREAAVAATRPVHGEPVLGVLLPVKVGAQLDDALQTLFRLPRGSRLALLASRRPPRHDLLARAHESPPS